nr:centromere/kinetochore protein zw10 homolog [Parasteatoda tepidariorum]
MVNSVGEFNNVVDDLKKIKKLKEDALSLSSLHSFLEQSKQSLSLQSYLTSAKNLLEFERVRNNSNFEDHDITVVKSLTTEFIVTKENLIYNLENAWHEKITISSSLEGRKKFLSLKIDKTASLENSSEIFKALKLLKQLKPVFKEFGKRFINLICHNVASNIVKITVSEDSSTLTVDVMKDHVPEPPEVFETLKEILRFLFNGILQAPLNMDAEENSFTAMTEFGMAIGDEFCTFVIEKCLKPATPKQSKQMEAFRLAVSEGENFCNFLLQLGFLLKADNKLIAFIYDVDILPVNKIAQDFLSRSRSCMKKNLHQTITVGVPESPKIRDVDDMTGTKDGLSQFTFSFPQCKISESMKELVMLLYEVKDEAKNIDSIYTPKLYYTSRGICELYCSVVPICHKEEIANIPQQTAIFHNNCMYLAHNLSLLGSLYENDLQQNIQLTYIDIIPEIRKLGAEAFLTQMRQQKQQLLQLLQEQACGSMLIDDGAVMKAEKAIRQCLYQLQLLKKVWSDVLPVEVYFKAIGTLLNTCFEEMIIRISSMEDIAAEAAAHLDSTFDILLKQSPDLFMTSSSDKRNFVHFYVKRWFKFQELQLILSASMREIVDRWSSGKGPLATHFTSEEVKHLIRALFQNTERRAAALAKIR